MTKRTNWIIFFRILCIHREGSGARLQDLILADMDDGALSQLGHRFDMIGLPLGEANIRNPLAEEWESTS